MMMVANQRQALQNEDVLTTRAGLAPLPGKEFDLGRAEFKAGERQYMFEKHSYWSLNPYVITIYCPPNQPIVAQVQNHTDAFAFKDDEVTHKKILQEELGSYFKIAHAAPQMMKPSGAALIPHNEWKLRPDIEPRHAHAMPQSASRVPGGNRATLGR